MNHGKHERWFCFSQVGDSGDVMLEAVQEEKFWFCITDRWEQIELKLYLMWTGFSLQSVHTKKIAFHVGQDACISLSIFITNALASPAHTQPSAVSRSTFFQDDGGQCHWKTQSNTRLLKGPYCNCKSLRRHITAGNNVQMCDFFRGERYHLHAAMHAACHLSHPQLCTMYHDVSLLRPCCSIHFFGSSMNQCCGKPSWKKLCKWLKLREVNRSAVLRRPLDKKFHNVHIAAAIPHRKFMALLFKQPLFRRLFASALGWEL